MKYASTPPSPWSNYCRSCQLLYQLILSASDPQRPVRWTHWNHHVSNVSIWILYKAVSGLNWSMSLSPNTIKGWELLSKWLDQHTWVVMFRWDTGNDSDIVIVFRVERTRWETGFGRFRKNWRICKQGAMTRLRYQHLWPTAFSPGQQTAGDGCHNWVYFRQLFVSHAADGELGAIKGHFICSWRFRLNLYGYSVKVISHFTMAS